MTKIQLLSDLHIELYKNSNDIRIEDTDADLILLAGDIHTKTRAIKWLLEQNISKPILYVCGNHEFYGTKWPRNIDKLKEAAKGTNIHVLENDYYIHNDLIILGCTLWTDFKLYDPITPRSLAMSVCSEQMNDYNRIRNSQNNYKRLVPSDTLKAHYESIDFLTRHLHLFKGCNIGVMTHHVPSIKCIDPRYCSDKFVINAAYASNLDEFVAYSGAKFWVVGHTHYKIVDMYIGDTRVISNPKGYLGHSVEGFDPRFTFEV